MEAVALNEELRTAFAPLLQPMRNASMDKLSVKTSSLRSRGPAKMSEQYQEHCGLMLRRLNSYEYTSKEAFCSDIKTLQDLDYGDVQKKELIAVLGQVLSSTESKMSTESTYFRGIQKLGDDRYALTLHLNATPLQIGVYESHEAAVKVYEEYLSEVQSTPNGLSKFIQHSEEVARTRQQQDQDILDDADNACYPQLSSSRILSDFVAISGKEHLFPLPSEPVETSLPMTFDRSAGSSVSYSDDGRKKKRSSSRKSKDRKGFLRLRRIIQQRLCPHLVDQEVCVFTRPNAPPDANDKAAWKPTGRLQDGRVFHYKTKEMITFAEFVTREMERTTSACPHIFLLSTKSSIDTHLHECDAFGAYDREQLATNYKDYLQEYMKAPPSKRSKR